MRRTHLSILAVGLLITVIGGAAQADLATIGTATYSGSNYKLIWEDDNNGNSLIWLDYTHEQTRQYYEESWAAGLATNNDWTFSIDPTYSVTWDEDAWRLPAALDGASSQGYNITNSEMGYLFYVELGNLGKNDASGNPQSGYGLTNTGNFDHLVTDDCYWSGTHIGYVAGSSNWVYHFDMSTGEQIAQGINYGYGDIDHYALAVRGGEVAGTEMVPLPKSVTLLAIGIGCFGLTELWRRRKLNLA